MRLNVRNVVAAAAAVAALLLALDRLGWYWSVTLIPDCVWGGQPLWQKLCFPLVPLLAGSLFAGGAFALVSSESVVHAAVIVGALVVLSPAVPAYMSFLPWPIWWYPLAWVVAVTAGLPGVVAIRGVQSCVQKWRRAT